MDDLCNSMYREEREMAPSLRSLGMEMILWTPVAMGYVTTLRKRFGVSEKGV